jgi:hypothetical protein
MTENEQIERLRQAIDDEANRQPKTWDWYDLARAAHAALRTQPEPQQDVAALCEWLGAIAGFIRDGWPPASEETPENISARLLQAADALTTLSARNAELEQQLAAARNALERIRGYSPENGMTRRKMKEIARATLAITRGDHRNG